LIYTCTYIKRPEIDEAKYNACIENSENGMIYASSWYLDAVCDHWDCLVLEDYAMVMPLPRKTKLGIDYIYLPCWIQQLGIFYSKDLSAEIAMAFLEAIPEKFVLTDIFFNAHNDFYPVNQIERINYTLELNQPYEALKRSYTKGRQSSISKAKSRGLVCRDSLDLDLLIELHQNNYDKGRARSFEDLRRLKELFTQFLAREKGRLILVYENGRVLGGALFAIQAGRIIYLFSALSEAGREQQAMSFLLDSLIKEYAETANVLDFEGSMVPGIASFFSSFGAGKERYFHFKRSRIPFFGTGKKEIPKKGK
jgi:hypothetical protein